MKYKFYFENEDAETAHEESFFQDQMKSECVAEMMVIGAIKVPHSKSDYVYCSEHEACFDKSECGKNKCNYYKSNNGKDGRCEFRGQYCEFGEKVILKLK